MNEELEDLLDSVEEEMGMCGLSTGLYAEYAREVAKRYAKAFAISCLPTKRKPEPKKHAMPFSNANTASRGWNDCVETTKQNINKYD
jgi:hypothetical protein